MLDAGAPRSGLGHVGETALRRLLALHAAGGARAATRPAPITRRQPPPSPGAVAAADRSGEVGAVVELASHPAAYIEAKAKREEVYGAIMGSAGEDARRGRQGRTEDARATRSPCSWRPTTTALPTARWFRSRASPIRRPPLADPVKLGQTPVGKAMKFEHRGEYDDIDSTYDAITAYLDEKGVDAQDVFVEEYLNEPKTPDDPNLQVDIYVLIR